MSEEIKNEDVVEQSPEVLEAPVEVEAVEPIAADEPVEAPVEPVVEEPRPVVVEEPKDVVTSGSQNPGVPSDEVAGITSVENGVIGAGTVKKKPKNVVKQQERAETEKVAIYSSKNVTWTGVGKVYRGFNIVTKDQADKWLTRSHVRVATPQEVAQEFGK